MVHCTSCMALYFDHYKDVGKCRCQQYDLLCIFDGIGRGVAGSGTIGWSESHTADLACDDSAFDIGYYHTGNNKYRTTVYRRFRIVFIRCLRIRGFCILRLILLILIPFGLWKRAILPVPRGGSLPVGGWTYNGYLHQCHYKKDKSGIRCFRRCFNEKEEK